MLKKLFSHSFIYGLGPFIPKMIGFLMLPIFTKYLTDVDYGIQAVINSSMGLIGVLSMLGLNLPLTTSFYHHRNHYKPRWRQYYGFLNVWMFFYSILLTIIIIIVVPKEAKDNLLYIIILNIIPLTLFGPTATIGHLYYQLHQKPQQILYRTLVISLLTVVLNYCTIVILDMHYMGWFISNCISTFILNISYWIPLHYKLNIKPIYRFKKYVIKRGLEISLPMIPHYYSGYLLNSADKLLLKIFSISTALIGFYGFASQFGTLAMMAVGAINTAASPILFELIKQKKYSEIKRIVWNTHIMIIALMTIGCIWLKELFGIFVNNEELKGAYYIAIVLIMAHAYRPIYFGATSVLFYREKTKNLWKVTFLSGVFCLIINIITIPIWGVNAPAYVLFISYLLMGYGTFFLKDYRNEKIINFKPTIYLIVHVIAFLFVICMKDQSYIYKLLASSLIILSFYFVRKLN